MGIDRRRLFALGGVGAFGVGTGACGPEIDIAAAGAITAKFALRYGEWCVLVPDWDLDWHVGTNAAPVKWMPLAEFLTAIEQSKRSA